VPLRFVGEAIRVLKSEGRIVLLLSSDSRVAPVRDACERSGLGMKLVGSKHLFYETLSVYEASR
jgi:hypothetical protein